MPTTTKSAERKLYRELNAPLAAVWDAWTDPEQVGQWWGPRGFTLTTHSRDLQSGGTWKYTMHGPDGVDYENFTKYLEVEKHKKLVYDHGGTETSKPLFRVTALFSEVDGKTHLDMTMAFPSAEACETTCGFIKKAGGDATWDRLAEYLEKKVHGKDKFVINRSFETSIDHMFKLWTDPSEIVQWSGPAGSSMEYKHCDIKVGGKSFYVMDSADGHKMYGRCQYIELQKPNRFVYTQQFCDENENVVRHPLAPTWPESMLTVVEFSKEGPDHTKESHAKEGTEQTRVTLTWEPQNPSAEELETFKNARAGMTQGWSGSFDDLDAYIEKQ